MQWNSRVGAIIPLYKATTSAAWTCFLFGYQGFKFFYPKLSINFWSIFIKVRHITYKRTGPQKCSGCFAKATLPGFSLFGMQRWSVSRPPHAGEPHHLTTGKINEGWSCPVITSRPFALYLHSTSAKIIWQTMNLKGLVVWPPPPLHSRIISLRELGVFWTLERWPKVGGKFYWYSFSFRFELTTVHPISAKLATLAYVGQDTVNGTGARLQCTDLYTTHLMSVNRLLHRIRSN